MLKLAAVIVLTGAFTTVGIYKATELSGRVKKLRLNIDFYREVKDGIYYTAAEVDKLIKEITSKPRFSQVDLQDSQISAFIGGLGKSDIAGQTAYCLAAIKNAEQELETAVKEKNEKSKIYTTLGICAGLAASILLI